MTKRDFKLRADYAIKTFAKLSEIEQVSLDVLLETSKTLGCGLNDVVKLKKEGKLCR
ncbi:hypothetical protein IJD15_02875 [bacterium]|nr:hypothetical protein [Clostridia bacterium]MBQ4078105.1 hypothetical protein [bacterium]